LIGFKQLDLTKYQNTMNRRYAIIAHVKIVHKLKAYDILRLTGSITFHWICSSMGTPCQNYWGRGQPWSQCEIRPHNFNTL